MTKTQLTYPIKSSLIAIHLAFLASKKMNTADKPEKQLFSKQKTRTKCIPKSIDFYSKRCLIDAQVVLLDDLDWQIMRFGCKRKKYPALISFIENLPQQGAKKGCLGSLADDISRKRGDPIPKRDTSHQIGLNVDILFS
ncbi:MAG: penicillin-insensitive murein endopeptidase [Candidatus Tokpelaia sp. JSC189]|nr:MAG: penicillin-insensitive murein endopeptidase [Candidatus Tokpelaia sp. JSC189]